MLHLSPVTFKWCTCTEHMVCMSSPPLILGNTGLRRTRVMFQLHLSLMVMVLHTDACPDFHLSRV